MKKITTVILCVVVMLSLAACGSNNSTNNDKTVQQSNETTNNTQQESSADESGGKVSEDVSDTSKQNKILVAYFSRTGENYGVGVVEKGNTSIIADMISSELGADSFEISRETPYPQGYNDTTDEAKKEQAENARPPISSTINNFDDYDVIFLGYPIWWGDMPMPVYTFLESYDFSGKTIVPFCTHAGSGLSSTVKSIQEECHKATVLEEGIAVEGTKAQNNQDEARAEVLAWLEKLKFVN